MVEENYELNFMRGSILTNKYFSKHSMHYYGRYKISMQIIELGSNEIEFGLVNFAETNPRMIYISSSGIYYEDKKIIQRTESFKNGN